MAKFVAGKKPIAPMIAALGPGESVSFPIVRAETVRSTVCTQRHRWGSEKRYKCTSHSEDGIITVTRLQ